MLHLDFEPDLDGKIWREELNGFLPDKLLDFHSHLYGPGVIPPRDPNVVEPTQTAPRTTDEFTGEDLDNVWATLFPGKQCSALLFGTVGADADLRLNNKYVAQVAAARNSWGLCVPILPATQEELLEQARAGGFLGYKPYWTLVPNIPKDDVTLEDMLPAEVRQAADALGGILMLHLPRAGRLADPKNVAGIIRLCRECPRAKIVLAHLGRAYMLTALERLDELLAADLDNLYWDFSNVQNWEVFEVFFRKVDHRRLFYGLDLPVAALKGKLVIVNEQNLFFTKHPDPFSIHNPTGAYRIRCTFYAYEIIRECKKALGKLGMTADSIVEGLFWRNGRELIGEVTAGVERQSRTEVAAAPSLGPGPSVRRG